MSGLKFSQSLLLPVLTYSLMVVLLNSNLVFSESEGERLSNKNTKRRESKHKNFVFFFVSLVDSFLICQNKTKDSNLSAKRKNFNQHQTGEKSADVRRVSHAAGF